MSKLRVHLFGKFEVFSSEQIIQDKAWQSRQVRTLFKVFVVNRGQALSYEQLLEILWPQEDPETTLERLYIRISQLRRVLKKIDAPVCLETVEGGYVLELCFGSEKNDYWVDADCFENLADQGRLFLEQKEYREAIDQFEQAQKIYRGDYLAEDKYKDWSMAERERLRDRYLIVLTELSEAYAQLGQYRRAINTCQKVLHFDPCREAAFVRLMLFYYYAGEKTKALKTFEHCCTTLKAELAVEPDPSTIEIANLIQTGTLWKQEDTPLYPPPDYEGRIYEVPYILGELPLVGREREYAWLINHWSQSPGCYVLIEGEAGVGKSRLLETFAGYIHTQGTAVFSAKGFRDQNTPFDTFLRMEQGHRTITSDIGENFTDQLRRLLRETDSSESLQDSSRVITWIKSFFLQFPAETVLIIDDAQWVDSSSLAVIDDLLGKLTVLLVFRLGENNSAQEVNRLYLKNHKNIAPLQLTLGRLSQADVDELLKRLSDSDLSDLSLMLYQKTEGNPLFLAAFLQNLFEQGNLFVDSYGHWVWLKEKMIDPIPNLLTLIEKRLSGLNLIQRKILDVLAVAGGEGDFDVLQGMLEIKEHELLPLVDTLIERNFVIEPRLKNSAELALPHGLYAEVITRNMPRLRKKTMHRRLADCFVKLGRFQFENAAQVARHALLGENYELALSCLKDAGQYVLKLYLPEQADQYFSQALTIMEHSPQFKNQKAHGELLFGRAESQRLMGNFKEALFLYMESIPALEAVPKQIAVFQVFQLNYQVGVKPEGFETQFGHIEQGLVRDGDSWALFFLRLSQAFTQLLRGDVRETNELNREAWAISRRLTAQGNRCPDWMEQRAFIVLARIHIQRGNFLAAKNICSRLINHTREQGPRNNRAAAHIWMGEACQGLSQYKEARNHFNLALKITEQANDPRSSNEARIGLGWVAFETGNYSEAFSLAQTVLQMSEKNQDVLRQGYALILISKLSLKTQNEGDVLPGLLKFLSITKQLETKPYQVLIMSVLAEVYLAHNQKTQVLQILNEAIPLAEQCGLKTFQGTLARLQARLENGIMREQALKKAFLMAEKTGSLFALGQAIHTQAELTTDPEKHENLLAQSEEIFRKIGAVGEITP